MNKTTSQNIFLFPATLCLLQFVFVFLSLFKSGFEFAPTVLIANLFFTILWIGLFIFHSVKFKSTKISIKGIILFLAYVFASFYIIKNSWFGPYLSLNCMKNLFEGRTFIDTLYHSSIAESFITNGYASVQINAPDFMAYHTLSHALIAFISNLFNLPCYVTYNYIYPLAAFPLLVYLFQKVVVTARRYLTNSNILSFIDKILITLILIGFGIWSRLVECFGYGYTGWLIGESYCVSIILLFLYFCIIDWGYRKLGKFDSINLYILIPAFILLMSYCKISTGFIFFIGISYFLFRKNLFTNRKWLVIFFYAFIFVLYYFIPEKFVPERTYTLPENKASTFELFHYVKYTCKLHGEFSIVSSIIHYVLMFAPIAIILLIDKTKGIFSIKIKKAESNLLLLETLIMTTAVSILPGILLHIDGGSAGYFEAPVMFEGLILLVAMDIFKKTNQTLINRFPRFSFEMKFHSKTKTTLNIFFAVFISAACLGCALVYLRYDRVNVRQMIKETFASEKISSKDYKIYTEIRNATKKNRNQYCIFLKDEADFIKLYDSDFYTNNPEFKAPDSDADKSFFIKPYLATAAYTGLPVINAMYIKDDVFYRGDDYEAGKYLSNYSLPPKICGDKVTLDNMRKCAKKLNKKYIVVIDENGYEIVDADKQ